MPTTDPHRNIALIRGCLWALVAIAAFAAVYFAVISPRLKSLEGVAALGRGDYVLEATDGAAFTSDSLKGGATAVFFGFTYCPDVCPTTLGDMAMWQEELAEQGKALRIFFVTVDPERDTLPLLRDFVSWVPGVQGVTGSPEEVAKAIRAFRVYAKKSPGSDGGYTMDHSSMTLLFNTDGEYSGLINYQEDPARTQDSLNRLFAS